MTGLNASGRVVGFYGYTEKIRGATFNHTALFAWDDPTQSYLDVTDDIGSISDGMATCVNDTGWIGGVCWTSEVGSQQQLGFVWLNGTATTFASPAGGDIDTVVAVNSTGQAVCTYIGDAGYKRAFFWDGTQSTDLGDLGDPDNSFIWPVSLSDAGQVVGTLYTENTPIVPPPTTAFVWLPGSTMSVVDVNNQFLDTTVVGQNGAGTIVGSFVTPDKVGSRTLVSGGYSFLAGADALTDLGSLGDGGTLPFFLNELDEITGTSYASDNTLHLFDWQATGPLTDQGSAQTAPTDTSFQLTSVNQSGDATGFVTDAQSALHVFVRAGGGNTLFTLEAVTNGVLNLTPSDANGLQVFINDTGLLACSGTDSVQGLPEVLLLTQDADGNGLPDGWEKYYFGGPVVDPEAPAPSGDGLTILEAYQEGIDPNDFYNGQLPGLTIISGTPQIGSPGGFAPQSLIVQVTDANGTPLVNAPIQFQADLGQLQASDKAALTNPLSVRTDENGQAQAFFQLPNSQNTTCTVTASATSNGNGQIVSVPFTITSDDGTSSYISPFAPTNFVLQGNTDGSVDMSWNNNTDDQTPVEVEIQQADGSWELVATLAPGTTSYHYTPTLGE